jgi:hypothetical protein
MRTNLTLFLIGGVLGLGLPPSAPAQPQSYSFQAIGGCQPNGINDEGEVVGLCNGPVLQGFIFSNGTTTLVTDPLDPTGSTLLYGINNDSVITGSSSTRSFLLQDGVFHAITEATSSVLLQAEGINNKGAFAGWLTATAGLSGFVFASKQIRHLASPANSINDSEDVVGTVLNSDVGYQIVGGVYSALSVPNSLYTYPAGINSQGTISGWYDDQNNSAHGFVMKNGTVRTIDYPAADFTRLGGINQSGQVAGFALVNGSIVGFVATPMP